MNQRLYSELSDSEKEELYNQYKDKKTKKLNICLVVYIILLISSIIGYFVINNNRIKDVKDIDLIEDYTNTYIQLFFLLCAFWSLCSIIINFGKRRVLKTKSKNTKEFGKYLSKRNIFLDKEDNQSDKSI